MYRLFNYSKNVAQKWAQEYIKPVTADATTQTDEMSEVTDARSATVIMSDFAKNIRYYTNGNEAYLEMNVTMIREKQYHNLVPHCNRLGSTCYLWSPDGEVFYDMHLFARYDDGMSYFYTSELDTASMCQLKVRDQEVTVMHPPISSYKRATPVELGLLLDKIQQGKLLIEPLRFSKIMPYYLFKFADKEDYLLIGRDHSYFTHRNIIKIRQNNVWRQLAEETQKASYTANEIIFCVGKKEGYQSIIMSRNKEDTKATLETDTGQIQLIKLDLYTFDLASIGFEQNKTEYQRVTPITPPTAGCKLSKNG